MSDTTPDTPRFPRLISTRDLLPAHPNLRPVSIEGLLRECELLNVIGPPSTCQGAPWVAASKAVSFKETVMEKTEVIRCCGDCTFFHRYGKDSEGGQCCRYPPTVLSAGEDTIDTWWPEVNATDFCGEGREKSNV